MGDDDDDKDLDVSIDDGGVPSLDTLWRWAVRGSTLPELMNFIACELHSFLFMLTSG